MGDIDSSSSGEHTLPDGVFWWGWGLTSFLGALLGSFAIGWIGFSGYALGAALASLGLIAVVCAYYWLAGISLDEPDGISVFYAGPLSMAAVLVFSVGLSVPILGLGKASTFTAGPFAQQTGYTLQQDWTLKQQVTEHLVASTCRQFRAQGRARHGQPGHIDNKTALETIEEVKEIGVPVPNLARSWRAYQARCNNDQPLQLAALGIQLPRPWEHPRIQKIDKLTRGPVRAYLIGMSLKHYLLVSGGLILLALIAGRGLQWLSHQRGRQVQRLGPFWISLWPALPAGWVLGKASLVGGSQVLQTMSADVSFWASLIGVGLLGAVIYRARKPVRRLEAALQTRWQEYKRQMKRWWYRVQFRGLHKAGWLQQRATAVADWLPLQLLVRSGRTELTDEQHRMLCRWASIPGNGRTVHKILRQAREHDTTGVVETLEETTQRQILENLALYGPAEARKPFLRKLARLEPAYMIKLLEMGVADDALVMSTCLKALPEDYREEALRAAQHVKN